MSARVNIMILSNIRRHASSSPGPEPGEGSGQPILYDPQVAWPATHPARRRTDDLRIALVLLHHDDHLIGRGDGCGVCRGGDAESGERGQRRRPAADECHSNARRSIRYRSSRQANQL